MYHLPLEPSSPSPSTPGAITAHRARLPGISELALFQLLKCYCLGLCEQQLSGVSFLFYSQVLFYFPLRFPALEVPISLKPEEVSRGNQNPVCFSLANTCTAPCRCLPTPCGRFVFRNRRLRGWPIRPPHIPGVTSRLGCKVKAGRGRSCPLGTRVHSAPTCPFFLPVDFFLSSYFLSVIFAFFFYRIVGSFYIWNK